MFPLGPGTPQIMPTVTGLALLSFTPKNRFGLYVPTGCTKSLTPLHRLIVDLVEQLRVGVRVHLVKF
jgi:hypothetical protein